MTIELSVVGQAAKRGIIPRLPVPERLVADSLAWVNAEYGSLIRSVRADDSSAGSRLIVDIHPAADPLIVIVDAEGRVEAHASTAETGPGYHTFVGRLLERLGEEQEIAWPAPPAARPIGAPPSWVGSRVSIAERPAVEKEHLTVLGRELTRAAELRTKRATGLHVGTRPGTSFTFEGAIATPLGPRDDAWLASALRDARIATDIRPWWTDATDAHHLLNRALVLLWTEIRWRPPADDWERTLMDEVLGLLRRALPGDAKLPFPWREWAELIELRGFLDPLADRVRKQAAKVDPKLPLIGYRRDPVEIEVEGWVLRLPGSFSDHRTTGEWSGSDRGRTVTVAATATRTANGQRQSADWFLTRTAGNLGDGVLKHEDGDLRGRARLSVDSSSGLEVAVLDGFSAVTGSGAAIRVEFEEGEDWRWAVDLWRSLRPA